MQSVKPTTGDAAVGVNDGVSLLSTYELPLKGKWKQGLKKTRQIKRLYVCNDGQTHTLGCCLL